MRIYIGLVSVFPKVHCPRRVIRLSFVEQQGFASSESCKTVSFADIAGTQESVDPIPAWVYMTAMIQLVLGHLEQAMGRYNALLPIHVSQSHSSTVSPYRLTMTRFHRHSGACSRDCS